MKGILFSLLSRNKLRMSLHRSIRIKHEIVPLMYRISNPGACFGPECNTAIHYYIDWVEKLISSIPETLRTLQVVNHGVPLKLVERTQEVCKEFFAKPMEEKMAWAGTKESMFQGYGVQMGDSKFLKDWRDFFLHFTLPLSRRNTDLWPADPADYRCTTNAHHLFKLQ